MPVYANEHVPYHMGAHLINDEIWECVEKDREELESKNNFYLEEIHVKAESIIDNVQEIQLCYRGGFKKKLLITIKYFNNTLYLVNTNIALKILKSFLPISLPCIFS